MFKPLSGAMAGRFRSAVIIESGPKIVEGLHTPVASNNQDDGAGSGEEKEDKKEEDRTVLLFPLSESKPLEFGDLKDVS